LRLLARRKRGLLLLLRLRLGPVLLLEPSRRGLAILSSGKRRGNRGHWDSRSLSG
jgi:hypothetical protein